MIYGYEYYIFACIVSLVFFNPFSYIKTCGLFSLIRFLHGKIIHYILNCYNLKTVENIDMMSSDAYIKCYRQYIWYIRYGPLDYLHPQDLEFT